LHRGELLGGDVVRNASDPAVGFITPIANMPAWLQPLTLFNPVRHFVEVMRAVMLKGSGFGDVLPQLAALGGMGLSIFGVAVLTLSRKLA